MNTATNSPNIPDSPSAHAWSFFRAGGVDHVQFRNGQDIAHLAELDLKLWLALAMPTKGIEFDSDTLAFIDGNKDGRIRPQELLAAVDWAKANFTSLDSIIKGGDKVDLGNIKSPAVLACAKRILQVQGKADATSISLADVKAMVTAFSQTVLNGDGVVIPESAEDAGTRAAIETIVKATGGVADRSGKQGVNAALLDGFFAQAQAVSDWHAAAEGNPDLAVAGDGTAAALAALNAVRAKVNDFFARTRLAAFDARAIAALNRQETEYLQIAAHDLTIGVDEVSGFPLARVEAQRNLPLADGINPAWVKPMRDLVALAVEPVLGKGKQELTEAEWEQLQAKLAPFAAHAASKPDTPVNALPLDALRGLLAGSAKADITALIAADSELKGDFDEILSVEKLVRFNRDLLQLLTNFVSFQHFYSRERAVFQAGTLYLDARACHLCIEVTDPAKHATLAALAGIYLVYCDVTHASGAKKQIVAAFTDGDGDNLMVGRNGVFYDRKGQDWDATITKVVANPISLREAFWSPYKKLLRMIEEMVAKRAAAADAAADAKLGKAATAAVSVDKTQPAAGPKKIDVGTVAALGVAVGAIGAAITGLVTGLMRLAWWQMPLVLVGIILAISLPSMVIAWLKLRRRNIAPVLDANGWAINTRAKINTAFGAALTDMPRLPSGSSRTLNDPFAAKRRPWALYLVLLALAVAAVWIRIDRLSRGHYFWQTPPAVEAPAEPAAPAAEVPAEPAP